MNVLTTDNQGLMRKHRFPREPAPTFCRFEPPSGHATRWRDRVAPPSPGWFGPSYQADLQLPEGPARTSVPCRQPGRGDAARHGRCFASGKVLQSCPFSFLGEASADLGLTPRKQASTRFSSFFHPIGSAGAVRQTAFARRGGRACPTGAPCAARGRACPSPAPGRLSGTKPRKWACFSEDCG